MNRFADSGNIASFILPLSEDGKKTAKQFAETERARRTSAGDDEAEAPIADASFEVQAVAEFETPGKHSSDIPENGQERGAETAAALMMPEIRDPILSRTEAAGRTVKCGGAGHFLKTPVRSQRLFIGMRVVIPLRDDAAFLNANHAVNIRALRVDCDDIARTEFRKRNRFKFKRVARRENAFHTVSRIKDHEIIRRSAGLFHAERRKTSQRPVSPALP